MRLESRRTTWIVPKSRRTRILAFSDAASARARRCPFVSMWEVSPIRYGVGVWNHIEQVDQACPPTACAITMAWTQGGSRRDKSQGPVLIRKFMFGLLYAVAQVLFADIKG